jgi:putative transcriptional regulator
VTEDTYRPLAEAFALGVLDETERVSFEAHVAGCAGCRTEVRAYAGTLGQLTQETPPVPPQAHLRDELLDLAKAPSMPIDLSAVPWEELAPGVRYHVHHEDPARGVRGCLIHAEPGARHPLHRHAGAENILVLKGALRDERGTYGPGELCRSAAGSVHSEEVVPGEDCLCYVVYYGELEMLE